MIQMSSKSTVQSNQQLVQLVRTLKHLVSEQQAKIQELQAKTKAWQKKYRQELHDTNATGKLKQTKITQAEDTQKNLQNFITQINKIRAKYDSHIPTNYSYQSVNSELFTIAQLIQSQYQQTCKLKQQITFRTTRLVQSQKNLQAQTKLVYESNNQTRSLKLKIESFQRQFKNAKQRADEYEEKLLAQIRRQQDTIYRLRQTDVFSLKKQDNRYKQKPRNVLHN